MTFITSSAAELVVYVSWWLDVLQGARGIPKG